MIWSRRSNGYVWWMCLLVYLYKLRGNFPDQQDWMKGNHQSPLPMKWTTSKFHCHSHSSHLNFAPVLAIREPVLSIRTNMALRLPVLDSLDWQAVSFLALFSQIQISGIELQMVSTCKAFLLLTYGPSPCLLLSPPSLILELMWHSSEVYQRQNSLCGIPHFTELRWSF